MVVALTLLHSKVVELFWQLAPLDELTHLRGVLAFHCLCICGVHRL